MSVMTSDEDKEKLVKIAETMNVKDELQEVVDKVNRAIPERLCVETDPAEYLRRFEVYFDGVKQTKCHTADARKGYIVRFKHAIGRLPVRDRNGQFQTETLWGKVEIKLK